MKKILLIAAIIMATNLITYAHSGGTNEDNCHAEKDNDEYHCHYDYKEKYNQNRYLKKMSEQEIEQSKKDYDRKVRQNRDRLLGYQAHEVTNIQPAYKPTSERSLSLYKIAKSLLKPAIFNRGLWFFKVI